MQAIIRNGLLFGVIFSLVMCLIIVGSLWLNPMMWAERAPEDIRQAAGPIDNRTRKKRRIFALLFVTSMVGILTCSVVRLNSILGGLTFWSVFLNIFIVVMVWNLVDLLLVDWLLLGVIQPDFIFIPGTEGMDSYKDFAFHFRGFLKGILYSLVIGFLVAGISISILWFMT